MALPKLEDWKAPWEVDAEGADIAEDQQEIDKGRLKNYLHGLLSDKEKLVQRATAAESERDTLKAEKDKASREDETEVQRLQRELEETNAKLAEAAKRDVEALKLRVALRQEGMTPKKAEALAKRLTGTTEDELDADAKALIEEFGLAQAPSGDGDEERGGPGGRPRPDLRNGGDPEGGKPAPKGKTFKDELDQIPRPGQYTFS